MITYIFMSDLFTMQYSQSPNELLKKSCCCFVLVLGVSLAAALYRLYAVNPLGSMFGMYQTKWGRWGLL